MFGNTQEATLPNFVAFPSPPTLEKVGPWSSHPSAPVNGDSFPFPLHPIPIRSSDSTKESFYDGCRSPKRRCISTVSGYLTPPSSPDRFIPCRRSPDSSAKSFHLSKSPRQLLSPERLHRQNSSSPDPFSSRNPRRDVRRVATEVSSRAQPQSGLQSRHVSAGAVWNIGGSATVDIGPVAGVPNGRGGLFGSGTNAPMFSSRFFEPETEDQIVERFEGRLAAALDIDQTSRTLSISQSPERGRSMSSSPSAFGSRGSRTQSRTSWRDGKWIKEGEEQLKLRDDFYCSILAYCATSRTLAVGLQNRVYLWSEKSGVQYPRPEEDRRNTYITSLSFSSTQGGHSILAIGRNNGELCLWSIFDEDDRVRSPQPHAVACLAFKPVITRRLSERLGIMIPTEELLVGDEVGIVYYYAVEWMSDDQVEDHRQHGTMHLLAKIDIHTQQICGLAWSPEGEYFSTGANDNTCCLFEVKDILTPLPTSPEGPIQAVIGGFDVPTFVPNATAHHTLGSMLVRQQFDDTRSTLEGLRRVQSALISGRTDMMIQIGEGRQKYKWTHSAAVKAISFCPWQRGLLATGGGSNDRAIHFYHAFSGACLATISVQAQVTSLVWSTHRREIAATFGYAQPEHPYRIAVFSWPDCRQVVAIPWPGETRALYAIAYSGNLAQETSRQRGDSEGCIVVASSDESVKFHEVWGGTGGFASGSSGLLGGSDILESLEGFDKEGAEVIR